MKYLVPIVIILSITALSVDNNIESELASVLTIISILISWYVLLLKAINYGMKSKPSAKKVAVEVIKLGKREMDLRRSSKFRLFQLGVEKFIKGE